MSGNDSLEDLVGLTIVGIKSIETDWRDSAKDYILMSDEKTILELYEQDYYSYHDCSTSAREWHVYEDHVAWEKHMKDVKR